MSFVLVLGKQKVSIRSYMKLIKEILANINILPMKNFAVGLTVFYGLTGRPFMLQTSLQSNSHIFFVFGSFLTSFIFSSISFIFFFIFFLCWIFLREFQRKGSLKIFSSLYINRVFLAKKFIILIEGSKFVRETLIYLFL